jgi:hypothetical protein
MSSQCKLVSEEGKMQMKIFMAWAFYGTLWSEFCALWELSTVSHSKQKCLKEVMVVKWRPLNQPTTSTGDLSALCRTHLELWLYHSPKTTPVTWICDSSQSLRTFLVSITYDPMLSSSGQASSEIGYQYDFPVLGYLLILQ